MKHGYYAFQHNTIEGDKFWFDPTVNRTNSIEFNGKNFLESYNSR